MGTQARRYRRTLKRVDRYPAALYAWAMTRRAMLAATPLAFCLGATASRWFFPTTETRYHILAFWLLAAMAELVANRIGLRASLRRFCLNATAAAVAGASVKWYTEGMVHRFLAVLL